MRLPTKWKAVLDRGDELVKVKAAERPEMGVLKFVVAGETLFMAAPKAVEDVLAEYEEALGAEGLRELLLGAIRSRVRADVLAVNTTPAAGAPGMRNEV